MRKAFFIIIFGLVVVLTPLVVFREELKGVFFSQEAAPQEQEEEQIEIAIPQDEVPAGIKIILDENQGARGVDGLKILSATLVGVKTENNTPGVRILGEVENQGENRIDNVRAVVHFFDKEKQVLASKIAEFNHYQGYEFLALNPGEINVYDVLVFEPPVSESLSIEMRSEAKSQKLKVESLKIKGQNLEPTIFKKDGQQIPYFKFTGTLVNQNNFEVVNPGVYVWLKDEEDKVMATGYRIFKNNLLGPGQELEVELGLLPFKKEDKEAFAMRVKSFGEEI